MTGGDGRGTEQLRLPDGSVSRLAALITSPVLLAIPRRCAQTDHHVRHPPGETACPGTSMRDHSLEAVVINAMAKRLLAPERLHALLAKSPR